MNTNSPSNALSARAIHILGFGSQGETWARALRSSGWKVFVYLAREGKGFQSAKGHAFEPQLLTQLTQNLRSTATEKNLIALLCPDLEIGKVYQELLAPLTDISMGLIIAHGYAVYSKELRTTSEKHVPLLLAPKAIGPKLFEAFHQKGEQDFHHLKAAFNATIEWEEILTHVAHGIGFSNENLIPATFEQETIGDLISEQGVLCGGVMSCLLWTMEAMKKAGVPDELIREECFTELELLTGFLSQKGPASTLSKISDAAKYGTIRMNEAWENSDFKKTFTAPFEEVQNGEFVKKLNEPQWREKFEKFVNEMKTWESRLFKK